MTDSMINTKDILYFKPYVMKTLFQKRGITMLNQKETIIPKGEVPEKMPSDLQVLYTFDAFGHDGERLTEETLKKLVKRIRKSKNISIFLCPNSDIETALQEEYMNLEINGDWIFFQYVVYNGAPDYCIYSCFDPDYLNSEEESPMIPGDGQSIILKKCTMHDPDLAANCIEYYVRTRQLYPGMAWLKAE